MSKGSDEFIPLWGALEGAPHPAEQTQLLGQEQAERGLLDAYRAGRLHHAWLLGGAEGVGKATLAYRMARFLMVNPDPASPQVMDATSLHVDVTHPGARQALRQAHPDIMVLQRIWNKERKVFYTDIRVDDVRRVVGFFNSTAGAGGWRVCIVDTADDLNTASANALLKVLEEPPPRCLFLLLSTAPRRLLPTIRSRCRSLMLEPLQPSAITAILQGMPDISASLEEINEAASQANGSVRRAVLLLEGESLGTQRDLQVILDSLPHLDRKAAWLLAESLNGREAEQAFERFTAQVQDWIHARVTQDSQSSRAELARWARLWEKSQGLFREAQVFNLDKRPLVLLLLSEMAQASRG